MAIVVKDVKFGDQGPYPLVFSSNALYKLEEKTGLTTERIGLMLMTGRAGYHMAQLILWAGLEAGRVRTKSRRGPWIVDEIGDLLDLEGGSAIVFAGADDGMATQEQEIDGVLQLVKVPVREPRPEHPLSAAMLEAWVSAFPKARELAAPANPPQPREEVVGDPPGMNS